VGRPTSRASASASSASRAASAVRLQFPVVGQDLQRSENPELHARSLRPGVEPAGATFSVAVGTG